MFALHVQVTFHHGGKSWQELKPGTWRREVKLRPWRIARTRAQDRLTNLTSTVRKARWQEREEAGHVACGKQKEMNAGARLALCSSHSPGPQSVG